MADDVAPPPDPRFKVKLRDTLMQGIYGPPLESMQAELDNLVLRNGQFTSGFISFRGRTWCHSLYQNAREPAVVARPTKLNLAPMAAWHEEMLEIEAEMRLAAGSLTAVLNAVHDPEDLFKVFPECLHQVLREFLTSTPMQPPFRTLTDEQIAELKAKQSQYLSLLQQRLMRTLINI